MRKNSPVIYIVGAGAIGMPLAGFLAASGVRTVAVRSSVSDLGWAKTRPEIGLANGSSVTPEVDMISLSELGAVDEGIVVVTAKATANEWLAREMKSVFAGLPLVVMQNGLGVERAFVEAGVGEVYRCVLYATGQRGADGAYRFREVAESPVGAVTGKPETAAAIAEALTTADFRFRYEPKIAAQAWKKTIINAAFNSICPLLGVDNGIFYRDASVLAIAKTIITEALEVARSAGIELKEEVLFEQLLLISRRSDGQLISTLQDINHGKETEIAFLNLEIARVGAEANPPVEAAVTRALGELIQAKAALAREA